MRCRCGERPCFSDSLTRPFLQRDPALLSEANALASDKCGAKRKDGDMGNREVITSTKRSLGVYLHWNGGGDSVESFLEYCSLRGFSSSDVDGYGWVRLVQVIANFMGAEGLSVGISQYAADGRENPGDNGFYVVKGWGIVECVYLYEGGSWGRMSMAAARCVLHTVDKAQSEEQRLGGHIEAEEVPRSTIRPGDTVFVRRVSGSFESYEVVCLDTPGRPVNGWDVSGVPYVAMCDGAGAVENN